MNEITPAEFMEWIAFDALEPVGLWPPASMVASVIANEIRLIAAGLGGQKIKTEDLYAVNDFVPGVAEKKQRAKTEQTLDSLDAITGL